MVNGAGPRTIPIPFASTMVIDWERAPSFEKDPEPGAISSNSIFCQPFDLIEENCIKNLGSSDERLHRGAARVCRYISAIMAAFLPSIVLFREKTLFFPSSE